ncbi:MAG: sigma-70 family RNA polymerase sigma factor [Syntrophomonadaceae bacterium]|nr:sigma-70 family RNA polymerase sigma factor [Syntrophomonadaceae bacterium]
MNRSDSDEILAQQVINGNLTAFEELVTRYQKPIFKLAYRMVGQKEEAEDLTQEVFIHLYQKITHFNPEKKFKPWLYRVAVNTCISRLRRKRKVIFLGFDDALAGSVDLDNVPAVSPEKNVEIQELQRELFQAVLEMPENYRAMIVLRYQLDLTNSEIAETLGITRENVEVRMHRAHKNLRRILLGRLAEGRFEYEVQAGR